jgi:hypothetical protein
MKKLTTIILFAATIGLLCLFAVGARAQTFQSFTDGAITNGAVGGGFWRGLTGNYNIASYDYLYSINPTTNGLSAGLILGGDYMWSGKKVQEQNDVKGGFSLQYTMTPLRFAGITNVLLVVNGGNALATPRQAGASVGDITYFGANYKINVYKTINFNFNPSWQMRVGQGAFDRQYVGIQGFFSLGF